MIDIDDLQAFRAWQAKNRRALYTGMAAFGALLLLANLIQIFGA